jgi:hypothetical protein
VTRSGVAGTGLATTRRAGLAATGRTRVAPTGTTLAATGTALAAATGTALAAATGTTRVTPAGTALAATTGTTLAAATGTTRVTPTGTTLAATTGTTLATATGTTRVTPTGTTLATATRTTRVTPTRTTRVTPTRTTRVTATRTTRVTPTGTTRVTATRTTLVAAAGTPRARAPRSAGTAVPEVAGIPVAGIAETTAHRPPRVLRVETAQAARRLEDPHSPGVAAEAVEDVVAVVPAPVRVPFAEDAGRLAQLPRRVEARGAAVEGVVPEGARPEVRPGPVPVTPGQDRSGPMPVSARSAPVAAGLGRAGPEGEGREQAHSGHGHHARQCFHSCPFMRAPVHCISREHGNGRRGKFRVGLSFAGPTTFGPGGGAFSSRRTGGKYRFLRRQRCV